MDLFEFQNIYRIVLTTLQFMCQIAKRILRSSSETNEMKHKLCIPKEKLQQN